MSLYFTINIVFYLLVQISRINNTLLFTIHGIRSVDFQRFLYECKIIVTNQLMLNAIPRTNFSVSCRNPLRQLGMPTGRRQAGLWCICCRKHRGEIDSVVWIQIPPTPSKIILFFVVFWKGPGYYKRLSEGTEKRRVRQLANVVFIIAEIDSPWVSYALYTFQNLKRISLEIVIKS